MSDYFLAFLAAAFCVLGLVAAFFKDFATGMTAFAAANLIGIWRLRNERARKAAASETQEMPK